MGKKNRNDLVAPISPISPMQASAAVKARVGRLVEHMIAIPPSRDDPNGSYTGRPMVRGEKPVQDVDDL